MHGAPRNTQLDETTTLDHANGEGRGSLTERGQDVSSEEADGRGSAFKRGNDQ